MKELYFLNASFSFYEKNFRRFYLIFSSISSPKLSVMFDRIIFAEKKIIFAEIIN